jgi:hypothetical protein
VVYNQRTRTVKDPHSPSVLRVQPVINGKVKEYTAQEDIEQDIQQECKVQFSLAHSAPIMKSPLGERLRYLSDKALARSIIIGTYDITLDMDHATRLVLEEIGKLGMKLGNGNGNKVFFMSEDFHCLCDKVNEFTSSSMSEIHYGHYKAAIQDQLSTEILTFQLTVIA